MFHVDAVTKLEIPIIQVALEDRVCRCLKDTDKLDSYKVREQEDEDTGQSWLDLNGGGHGRQDEVGDDGRQHSDECLCEEHECSSDVFNEGELCAVLEDEQELQGPRGPGVRV